MTSTVKLAGDMTRKVGAKTPLSPFFPIIARIGWMIYFSFCEWSLAILSKDEILDPFQRVSAGSTQMPSEFLPRAHSKRLGELDASNWKDLGVKGNTSRVDPAIREIVSSLNQKGYVTFSSCSGGHKANLRRRFDRHESGYIAFSPPSRIPFELYLALKGRNRDFMFEAEAVIHDGNGDRRETVYTQLDWQLVDQRKPRREYYEKLFLQMTHIIQQLPGKPVDQKEVLTGLLGRKRLAQGSRIVNKQMNRFTR